MIQFPFKSCVLYHNLWVYIKTFCLDTFYSANYRKRKLIVKAHWWLLSDCWTYTADKHENGLTSRWIKWNLQSPLHMSSVYPLLTWSKCLKISFRLMEKTLLRRLEPPKLWEKTRNRTIVFSLPSSSRWVMAKIISYITRQQQQYQQPFGVLLTYIEWRLKGHSNSLASSFKLHYAVTQEI